ncbi:hypothetical protein [Rhizobium leguminosarum]|uniref:hypothetical protein n=1 Tax=Rhizobium leguminosarum TaxID=384 RepID=UPI001C95E7E1|nr:hypothetical protein [Rhizobium leguminosarum]MBY5666630.1 hypothetical protein [Rhizobium leguminosarum]MBY5680081.1 hypothetical protein [Rhizobium leguminosarum]
MRNYWVPVVLLVSFPCEAFAEGESVRDAANLVLELCLARSTEIEITGNSDTVEVAGDNQSIRITKKQVTGLAGGISRELTELSSQQASETRACTQKYLREILDLLLKGTPEDVPKDPDFWSDTARYWGTNGLWNDPSHYCEALIGFTDAAKKPRNFYFSDSGERVSIGALSSKQSKIEGNFFIRTDEGSSARFCGAFDNKSYYGVACSRLISNDDPKTFASVYSKTLRDLRACLPNYGWRETSVDQGACLPRRKGGDCVHRFSKDHQGLWLYSALNGDRYEAGIQVELGPF